MEVLSAACESPFFGISLSIIAFAAGVKIQKKTGLALCNPLIIAAALIIAVLLLFRIPLQSYRKGGDIIQMFLAPATACLAVSIHAKIKLLKQNWLPVLAGCAAGSAASMASVYGMCRLFGLDNAVTAALLPKSVTTPIAVSIAAQHGGVVPITVAAVIITGITGSIISPLLIKLFRISNPVEAGISIGTCSHAIGTSKAIELGETEGAMSGLAIGISGIITVLFSLFLFSAA